MYPMKMIPAYKNYLWGGRKLYSLFHKGKKESGLAESWEISCHQDGLSRIAEGDFQGEFLRDVLQQHGNEWIGELNQKPGIFPVLIKWIDAAEPLSVQVHPSDENAQVQDGEQGKAEMWYIVEAVPHAFIYYGLERRLAPEVFIKHALDGSICEDLHRVEVHPGEVYSIMPGTVHALGAGIVAAEVQQNSNTTFRIYDYSRRDTDGRKRPLHIKRAVQTADLVPLISKGKYTLPRACFPGFLLEEVFRCSCFRVIQLQLEHSILWPCRKDSFHAFLWLEGRAELIYQEKQYVMTAGESCFIPAGMGLYEIRGQGKALMICL